MSYSFAIARFRNCRDVTPRQLCLSWAEIVEMVSDHIEREWKDGPCFSPTSYHEGATRGKENVVEVSNFVLDVDDGAAVEPFLRTWREAGHAFAVYSSYSHKPEKPKWRAVFPLCAPIAAAQWPAAYSRFAVALGKGHADPVCHDPSRLWYLPACPPDARRFTHTNKGAPLTLAMFPQVKQAKHPTSVRHTEVTDWTGNLADVLLDRALLMASAGRHNACLWLCCQCRDNGLSEADAEGVVRDYQNRVPQGSHLYEWDEARRCVHSVYRTAPREPWKTSTPKRDYLKAVSIPNEEVSRWLS